MTLSIRHSAQRRSAYNDIQHNDSQHKELICICRQSYENSDSMGAKIFA
jgi:hypothetical protein